MTKYSIEELSLLSGFPRRTIRYYVQEGLLEAPAGRGRGGFYYDSHLNRLAEIKTLQQAGMRLEAITRYLKSGLIFQDAKIFSSAAKYRMTLPARDTGQPEISGESWTKHEIISGFEINVRVGLENKRANEIAAIIKIANSIMKEDPNNGK